MINKIHADLLKVFIFGTCLIAEKCETDGCGTRNVCSTGTVVVQELSVRSMY